MPARNITIDTVQFTNTVDTYATYQDAIPANRCLVLADQGNDEASAAELNIEDYILQGINPFAVAC